MFAIKFFDRKSASSCFFNFKYVSARELFLIVAHGLVHLSCLHSVQFCHIGIQYHLAVSEYDDFLLHLPEEAGGRQGCAFPSFV